MIVTTEHIFDEVKIYPWDILDWVEEGQTEYGNDLNLRYTDITHLPDNMKVDGYLDLRGTNIAQLPDNLRVEYGLNLGDTNITDLPDDLYVGGSLTLSNTNMADLPVQDSVFVGMEIFR